jgi:tRNA modification GTPase
LRLSVKTGEGLDRLKTELVLAIEKSYSISGEDLILTSTRQVEALTRVQNALVSAQGKFETKAPVELLASDLRQALDALGEVLGLSFEDGASRIDNEAMLDRLFRKFCIGK